MDAPGFMDGGSEITKAFILAMIKTRSVTPTVDAIPVVRCKDCKHGEEVNSVYLCGKTRGFGIAHEPGWFCADGEMKNAEND